LSGLGSVTNSGDGVIEVGSASSRVEDTTGVTLEDESIGLDGDGGWGGGDGGLELGNGVGWDVGVGLDIDLSSEGGGLARSVSGGVTIVGLEVLSLFLSILEGGILPSSIATVGSGIAVNELLLGEGEKVSGRDEMTSLNGSGSRESPA